MSLNFNEKNAIEINSLSKEFKNFSIKDLNLNIPKGCITGFIGQNGAGKSTTFKAILNIISIDGGKIKVFGADNIQEETQIKENVGVVFDTSCFHPKLKIKQLNTIMKNIYKKWEEKTFFDYLEKFNIHKDKRIGELSRGMQMKLQIAIALSHQAKLLIMDEPTGGLDPIVRNEILDIFMDFIQDDTHTVFLSSHIITDIERIADYIVFIANGKLLISEDKETMASRHGIIRCTPEQFNTIDKADIINSRKSTFGMEVLTGDIEKAKQKYSDLICEKTSLEEIMLFYVKGHEGKE